MKGENN